MARRGIEPPKTYLGAGDLQSLELTTCSTEPYKLLPKMTRNGVEPILSDLQTDVLPVDTIESVVTGI